MSSRARGSAFLVTKDGRVKTRSLRVELLLHGVDLSSRVARDVRLEAGGYGRRSSLGDELDEIGDLFIRIGCASSGRGGGGGRVRRDGGSGQERETLVMVPGTDGREGTARVLCNETDGEEISATTDGATSRLEVCSHIVMEVRVNGRFRLPPTLIESLAQVVVLCLGPDRILESARLRARGSGGACFRAARGVARAFPAVTRHVIRVSMLEFGGAIVQVPASCDVLLRIVDGVERMLRKKGRTQISVTRSKKRVGEVLT